MLCDKSDSKVNAENAYTNPQAFGQPVLRYLLGHGTAGDNQAFPAMSMRCPSGFACRAGAPLRCAAYGMLCRV